MQLPQEASQRSPHIERCAWRVNDFCKAHGLGRTKVYELIGSGKLRTVMVGGRRLIPSEFARALIGGAP